MIFFSNIEEYSFALKEIKRLYSLYNFCVVYSQELIAFFF